MGHDSSENGGRAVCTELEAETYLTAFASSVDNEVRTTLRGYRFLSERKEPCNVGHAIPAPSSSHLKVRHFAPECELGVLEETTLRLMLSPAISWRYRHDAMTSSKLDDPAEHCQWSSHHAPASEFARIWRVSVQF